MHSTARTRAALARRRRVMIALGDLGELSTRELVEEAARIHEDLDLLAAGGHSPSATMVLRQLMLGALAAITREQAARLDADQPALPLVLHQQPAPARPAAA